MRANANCIPKTYQKILQQSTINPGLIKAETSLPILIATLAKKIKQDLKINPKSYKFNEVVDLSLDNPLSFGANPVWIFRELTSAVLSRGFRLNVYYDVTRDSEFSNLLKRNSVRLCEYQTVEGKLKKRFRSLESTDKSGHDEVKSAVSRMIEKRDGLPTQKENILLSNGASAAIQVILELIINKPGTGIMIPIPNCSLYPGLVSIFNGEVVSYALNEQDEWSVSEQELERVFLSSANKGVQLKAIIVINPGNPTGNVMDLDKMQTILRFASRHQLLVMADEVCQENVYTSKPWHSFAKVLKQMETNVASKVELVSFHSISKGVLGEGGLKGGYLELTNVDAEFKRELADFYSNTWPNNIGQFMLMLKCMYLSGELQEFMPTPLFELLDSQYKDGFDALRNGAVFMGRLLNGTKGIKCGSIEGGMSVFPQLTLPKKLLIKASQANLPADVFYCKLILERSGICLGPGSGYGQAENTFHFRTTVLPMPNKQFGHVLGSLKTCHEQILEDFA